MTSFPRRAIVLIPWFIGACGITIPGGLSVGGNEPGVGTFAGRGGSPAGAGAGAAGAAGSIPGRGGAGGVTPVGGSGPSPAGAGGRSGARVDRDGDGSDARFDCNDLNPGVHPGAPDECCDKQDSDCDGGDAPAGAACKCAPPITRNDRDRDGFSGTDGDCNDQDPSFFPGNPKESCCDGLDHDCDGRDDPQNVECDCASDFDGDGWYAGPFGEKRDCDDWNPSVNPGALEICGDGIDNDCDGVSDDKRGCTSGDIDGDGYPALFDCNDLSPSVHPGAPEWCFNGIDEDCDGLSDMQDADCFAESDNDGDGFPSIKDCDDWDSSVYPGAYEPCNDGRDSNCDGRPDSEDYVCRGLLQDADGDGYTHDLDCNDWNASIYPGAPEYCGDGVDNDCDGVVDRGCGQDRDWDRDGYPNGKDCNDSNSDVFPGSPYDRCCDGVDSDCDGSDSPRNSACDCMPLGDSDGDGFGVGFSEPGLADCNDQDPSIHPGAGESCWDGRDNDCDGRVDSNDPDCAWIE